MKLALPKFQYRFMPTMGNVIHPGNFHPVGTQAIATEMAHSVPQSAPAGSGGAWLVVGGSGGFGSAARIALARRLGAHTLNVSLDGQPNPQSSNKVRRLGSPGHHRTVAIERALREAGSVALTVQGDAFSPDVRTQAIETIREHFGGKIRGLVWALAAPRATDPRTGKPVTSVLKPLGAAVRVKNFTGGDPRSGEGPRVDELELPPGSPEEAIRTIFVMGGGVVGAWVSALLEAGVAAPGFCLLTISYRGNALNEGIYRKGLIGLAKADLEFETAVLDHQLSERVGGRAIAVEGPAVVTEASGGIPGVPFYMAHLLDVMGADFEDPVASMDRMFSEKLVGESAQLDDEGLLRMDDRELRDDVQVQMRERFERSVVGDPFPESLMAGFMQAYGRTRGFSVSGVDYDAEFDADEVCGES